MNTPRLAASTLLALAAAAPANAAVFVDARANIFGYGLSTPASGGGGGVPAVVIPLIPGTGRTLSFAASGQAGWAGSLLNGPDGGNFSSTTNIPAVGPISGFSAPLSGHLVGLFIEAGDISALAAPAGAAYPDLASLSLPSYSPLTRQVFFIGDGLTATGSGATQTFSVPDNAASLVLGIADAFGFQGPASAYDDNVGGYDVDVTQVPAPAAGALAALALATLTPRRRR